MVAEALVEPSHEFKPLKSTSCSLPITECSTVRGGGGESVRSRNRRVSAGVRLSRRVVVDTTVNVDANDLKRFSWTSWGRSRRVTPGGVALRADESLYVIGLRFTGQVFTTIRLGKRIRTKSRIRLLVRLSAVHEN